jgi:hypothetical protein
MSIPDEITITVVGVTHVDGYPQNLHRVEGAMIFAKVDAFLVREPDNPADPNAIAVWVQRPDDAELVAWPVGWVPAPLAARMAPGMDWEGDHWEGEVAEVREQTMEKPGISVRLRRLPPGKVP